MLVLLSLVAMLSLLSAGRVHANDYKHLWLGTRVLTEGGSPYDPGMLMTAARQYDITSINPYVYLPATALFILPFALLPFSSGMLAWFAFNWLLAWATVLCGPAWVRLERPARAQLLGALFLVGSMPMMRQMTAGQMNLVVLGAILLAWGWLIRGRQLPAGVVLGLAAAFKIAPLFLLMPLVGLRRWRACAGLIGGFLTANLLALLLFGLDVHRDALPVLSRMGYGQSTWAEFGMDFYRDPFNQSLNSLLHHLFTENPYTSPWIALGSGVTNGLTLGISVLMLGGFAALLGTYFMRFVRPAVSLAAPGTAWGDTESSLFLIGVMLMLLLPSLCWDHYALQALPAMFWMAGAPAGRDRGARTLLLLVAFALLSLPWMHTSESFRQGPGILLMSIRLGGLLLILAYLAVQSSRRLWAPPLSVAQLPR
jgi:hypothetical protein